MGKGSKRRPQKIDDKIMQENWDRIFGKKKEVKDDNDLRKEKLPPLQVSS